MKYGYVAPEAVVLSVNYDDVIRTSDQGGDNETPLFPSNGKSSINDLDL